MRFVLSFLAVVAALVLIAVSGACNFLFMQSIGKTETEGLVLGSASVAVDVFKALLPVMMWWAWKDRRFGFLLPAAVVFALFSAWSLASAIGFSATNRGHVTETREGLNAEFTASQADIKRAEDKLAALIPHRSAGVVENEIAALRQNRRWRSTKGCVDGGATASASRSFCAGYFKLKGELAAAIEDGRLTRSLKALRAESGNLKDRGAGKDVDPQVSFLAKLVGRDEGSVRTVLIVFIAGLLEVGSGLGLWLATGHSEIFRRRRASEKKQAGDPVSETVSKWPLQGEPSEVVPAIENQRGARDKLARRYAVEAKKVGDLDDFCYDRLHPADDGALSEKQIYQGYIGWCQAMDFATMDEKDFRRDFGALAKDVGLPRNGDNFVGVALVGDAVIRSAAAS